ncbi:GIY-YIG nuclease family protein [Aquisalinus flavus]|nr:GIY-YIG nuclease family protein [Aquisalinus flavus]MBD0427486.1 GIY-YIG nuclease family protein [Aquisalinus flavus]UNE49214.1 GIY-YIG nuclease family protein [Aquisalinus flavus]
MVRCVDGKFYVGSHRGSDVMNRVHDHNNGLFPAAFTYRRRPVELVWSDYFYRYDEMVTTERKLKGWSRAKKEALISGDERMLKILSKRKQSRDAILRGLQSQPHPEVAAQQPTKDEAEIYGLTAKGDE